MIQPPRKPLTTTIVSPFGAPPFGRLRAEWGIRPNTIDLPSARSLNAVRLYPHALPLWICRFRTNEYRGTLGQCSGRLQGFAPWRDDRGRAFGNRAEVHRRRKHSRRISVRATARRGIFLDCECGGFQASRVAAG